MINFPKFPKLDARTRRALLLFVTGALLELALLLLAKALIDYLRGQGSSSDGRSA